MSAYQFRWASSYQGEVEYEVWAPGEAVYRVELRTVADDWMRRGYNGDDEEFRREVVETVGLLRRKHDCGRGIPDAVVDAFNTWRLEEHRTQLAKLRAAPERYGEIADDDPLVKPPTPARGARYVIGLGWLPTGTPAHEFKLTSWQTGRWELQFGGVTVVLWYVRPGTKGWEVHRGRELVASGESPNLYAARRCAMRAAGLTEITPDLKVAA
jgi:hypothetical protein